MTRARAVFSIVALLTIPGSACSSSSSTSSSEGGSGGSSGKAVGSGGTAQPGSGGAAQPASGGAAAGQSNSAGGGALMGGASSGGSAPASVAAGAGGSSGSLASGGTAGSGAGGTGGAGTAGSTGTDAVNSDGCGKAKTLQNGNHDITFNGASRKYILRVPDAYDNGHPYRLVFAFAESGSSAMSVANRNYFTLATLDSKNTIFVAPDAANGAGSWSKSDVELTDAILAQLEGDLCIDKSRIFASGFSFGGAMSIALACTRADVFRAVAFFSGADLTGSCPTTLTKPIAYYASQASQDSTGTPMPSSGKIKQAEFAAVNGCMPEPSATTFPAAGQPHTCTDYKGCSAGHPTKYCVFDGPHGWEPKDPGQTTSWNAPEAWKFITQF
ncbi:MAG TPA: hypothetical protein VFK05_24580 [Polyangiaceae bacterium]|nr:hypothetical protein [Polyangiaceae bacterium]